MPWAAQWSSCRPHPQQHGHRHGDSCSYEAAPSWPVEALREMAWQPFVGSFADLVLLRAPPA